MAESYTHPTHVWHLARGKLPGTIVVFADDEARFYRNKRCKKRMSHDEDDTQDLESDVNVLDEGDETEEETVDEEGEEDSDSKVGEGVGEDDENYE